LWKCGYFTYYRFTTYSRTKPVGSASFLIVSPYGFVPRCDLSSKKEGLPGGSAFLFGNAIVRQARPAKPANSPHASGRMECGDHFLSLSGAAGGVAGVVGAAAAFVSPGFTGVVFFAGSLPQPSVTSPRLTNITQVKNRFIVPPFLLRGGNLSARQEPLLSSLTILEPSQWAFIPARVTIWWVQPRRSARS
jgi:hypothetical protein